MENLSGFKILVVDDTPELLDITSRTLRKANYTVLTASTGNECNKILESEKPDLVLLDIMLPDANGLDLCRAIKKNPLLSSTHVILFSSIKKNSEDISESLEGGADGYIARPIENRELLARVISACRIIMAEKQIKKDRILLEACINGDSDMQVFAIDNEYNYLTFNKYHKELILSKYGKVIEMGLSFLENIIIHDDKTNWKICLGKALNGESHFKIEEYGEKFYQTTYNPIYNENDEIIGATAFSLDITNLKITERNLLKKIEEMEVFNKMAIDRELTMIDLKKEVNQILISNGGKEKYKIAQ